ncbi:hypothetical protein GMOD_00003404 [Pyrenophora seminiperda CCB06]|uniref:Uncharacterized protein n=1 Tax=Pyrenophora seminiperda CCB06 TaxID=1302712 RepID=A0A3M7MIW3_9PLEO|nr:hypothetical protein GMOD_00003404 [Pyrenophora seminiperda CCB06]
MDRHCNKRTIERCRRKECCGEVLGMGSFQAPLITPATTIVSTSRQNTYVAITANYHVGVSITREIGLQECRAPARIITNSAISRTFGLTRHDQKQQGRQK